MTATAAAPLSGPLSGARLRATAAAGALALLAAVTPLGGNHPTAPTTVLSGTVRVIVVAEHGAVDAATASVVRAGGTITRSLGVINGFVADVPRATASQLDTAKGIAGVSLDQVVHAQAAGYDAATDVGSMYSTAQLTGADDYWTAGFTGKGVGVALIDSGVAPVDGLRSGNVVDGPDLSFESQSPNLEHVDTFGHGTHMAGIIGGRADGATSGTYATDTTHFLGMAPDSTIVSVKVADHAGATDVSQVIAAIDWVVQHRNDPGLNIRVLNLSYGTDSAQAYTVDPLAFAAEQAWKAGIFVVAATGNAGFKNKKTSSMTNPAYDPNIMAVGAADTNGTLTMADDTVGSFSSTGNGTRKPDVVAPGAHIVSLRAPGSFVDQEHADTGSVSDTLFRGSGTSQATAVVSGAAALVIQQRPTIKPSQLKRLFMDRAQDLHDYAHEQQGEGEINLAKMRTAGTPGPAGAKAWSTGTGSLELSRGTSHLTDDGVDLTGEQDAFGNTFDSAAMAASEAAGTAWSDDGSWNGGRWSGGRWSGGRWSTTEWTGGRWSGGRWSDIAWESNTWSGGRWSGGRWSGGRWSGGRWSDDVWASSTWD